MKDNGKVKTENGKLRVSESRNKACFDYAERKQVQDRNAGLKRKSNIPPPRFALVPLTQRDSQLQ
jgi:hypothetical protein